MSYKNPDKQREYQKEWIIKNQEQKEKNKISVRKRKQLIAEKMLNHKLEIGKCYMPIKGIYKNIDLGKYIGYE